MFLVRPFAFIHVARRSPSLLRRILHRLVCYNNMDCSVKEVLITDQIDRSCIDILQENGVKVNYKPKLPQKDILQHIKEADGLIVRSGTTVTADIIDAGRRLKIIGRAGVGVDNIDCDAATRNGVVVINAPGGNTISAAEHTCAMILAMARFIPQGVASMKAEKWDRSKLMGMELQGKTLAIVGLGRIGREVAHRMQSFGMKTVGFDPLVSAEESATFGVQWLPLDDVWPVADVITLHVPLIPQTKNLVNRSTLSKCRKGVLFVNVARGGILEDEALIESMDSGHCGGVAVDVYAEEPPTQFALIKHPKVICTPHLGASTHEAQVKVAQEIATQIVDFTRRKPLYGAVNAPSLNASMQSDLRPWVHLADRLSRIATLMTSSSEGKNRFNLTLHHYGSPSQNNQKDAKLLVTSSLMGILGSQATSGSTTAPVNLINAPSLAAQLGIQAKSEFHQEEIFGGGECIGVELANEGGERHLVVGSVAGHVPFLWAVDGHAFVPGSVPLTAGNDLYFFKKPAAQKTNIANIIAEVTSSPLCFAAESKSGGDGKWFVLGFEVGGGATLNKPLPASYVTHLAFQDSP